MSRAMLILSNDQVRARAKHWIDRAAPGVQPAPETKTCAFCKKAFVRDRSKYGPTYWRKAKYCSPACGISGVKAEREAACGSLSEEFNKHVERGDGCWEWRGVRDRDGYGIFSHIGRQWRAHKLALELSGTPVEAGRYACHHCDNPGCVRPSHLYSGTPAENAQDAVRRGRARRASKLTPEDVLRIRAAPGTHADVAAAFGTCASNVSMIKTRRTWKSVP